MLFMLMKVNDTKFLENNSKVVNSKLISNTHLILNHIICCYSSLQILLKLKMNKVHVEELKKELPQKVNIILLVNKVLKLMKQDGIVLQVYLEMIWNQLDQQEMNGKSNKEE